MNARRLQDPSLHKLLAEAIPLAIFLTDPAGLISGWTGSAEKMLGFAEPDVIGRPFDTLFDPAYGSQHRDSWAIELSGRAANYKDIGRATKADGSQFLAIFTMDRVTDERGGLIGYACTLGPV
jgi:PAS domain S-box-containing protein